MKTNIDKKGRVTLVSESEVERKALTIIFEDRKSKLQRFKLIEDHKLLCTKIKGSEIKTIIEDVVLRMQGGKEVVLPEKTTIGFQIGNTFLSCTATEHGLEISKRSDHGFEADEIMTVANGSNRIYIK